MLLMERGIYPHSFFSHQSPYKSSQYLKYCQGEENMDLFSIVSGVGEKLMGGRFRLKLRSNLLSMIATKHWNRLLCGTIRGFPTKIRQPFVWDSCSEQGIRLEDLQDPFQFHDILDFFEVLSSTRTFLVRFL